MLIKVVEMNGVKAGIRLDKTIRVRLAASEVSGITTVNINIMFWKRKNFGNALSKLSRKKYLWSIVLIAEIFLNCQILLYKQLIQNIVNR
jgi:hypothetical protein